MSERAARAELARRLKAPILAEEVMMMRVPDAAGQVRSAPVRALRGFFAGIGQLLITADQFRAEEARREQAGREAAQRTAAGQEQSPAGEADRDRDGGAGHYEPLTAPAGHAGAAPAARPMVSSADLPVPGYDDLTLASLRSRLRYLDAAQLRVLAEYEKANANRADVVGMFERRLAKLRAQDAHAT
jgi:hypothetical protein